MGAYNELYRTFSIAAKNSTNRIFNDAADTGYAYNTNNTPQFLKNLFDEINDIKKYPEMVISQWTSKDKSQTTITLHVAIEYDGNYERGFEYTVHFSKLKPNHPSLIQKNCNAFVSVHISIYRKPRK